MIPRDYSHEAEDISPPLEWSGVPPETAELALVLASGTLVGTYGR